MNRHFISKTVWGLFFIAAGVLFLLHQQDIIHIDIAEIAGTYWPVILILVGLQGMAAASGGIWNIFIMLLGGYFLLRNLHVDFVEDMEIRQFAIPAVLIILGLSMLTRGSNRKREEKKAMLRRDRQEERERRRQERDERRSRHHHHGTAAGPTAHGEPAEEEVPPFDAAFSRKIEQDLDKVFHERVVKKLGEDLFPLASEAEIGAKSAKPGQDPNKGSYSEGNWDAPPNEEWKDSWYDHGEKPPVERSNFIGDIYLGRDYWQLEPMNISHFIGDTRIDLTKASIPMGETKLNVSAFIGDVKVYVPNDIQLEISVNASAFIGDMHVLDRHEGGILRSMRYDTRNYAEADKKIHLTVSMFIGDITVNRFVKRGFGTYA
jgi:lia operon protein LiaF